MGEGVLLDRVRVEGAFLTTHLLIFCSNKYGMRRKLLGKHTPDQKYLGPTGYKKQLQVMCPAPDHLRSFTGSFPFKTGVFRRFKGGDNLDTDMCV